MHLENRWFTKLGKAKRIEKAVEPFRQWANENKQHFLNHEIIKLTASLRVTYGPMSLEDACNLMVYLVGCYSNAAQYGHLHSNGRLFRSERYNAGKLVAEQVQEDKPFDVRKLELVK